MQKSIQADPERQPSSPMEEAPPATRSIPCSLVDTGPSTFQPSGITRQGSREESLSVSSSDGSTINLSESEDSLSLQSRFRFLHKATKNPLSGLDLSRTNLPPNIRKLLSKRCSSDAKNATDGEAISSSCQTLQRASDNDDVFDMPSTATQGQSSFNASSMGIMIQSASGSVAAVSSRSKSPVEVRSAGIAHAVTNVRNTDFSHNLISLQSSLHSDVNSATVVIGRSSRKQSLNVDGPTPMSKESYVSSETPACSHGGTASSNSSSTPSVTLDKRQSLLESSSTGGICLSIPKPTTNSTSQATKTTDGTLSCIVYTLSQEKPSFVSQGLSTYTVSASLSDVRDGTYHHAVELHKNNANGIRDIYRLATSIASSLAQATSSSEKQVENANVPLSTKSPMLTATISTIATSAPKDSFFQRGTLVPSTTATTSTGVFNVDERSIRCLEGEIEQAVDIRKMTTIAQTSSSLSVQSNVLESGTTHGEKAEHEQKSQNKLAQKEGSERQIADKQVFVEENLQRTKNKEGATDSVQVKANVYNSTSSLEVDSGQRTMLRAFFDNIRKKKESQKHKESVHSSRKVDSDASSVHSTAVVGLNASLLLENGVNSEEKSNEAFIKMEGSQQSFKKDRQSMKRKVMEAESSEFKRRRVDKGNCGSFFHISNFLKCWLSDTKPKINVFWSHLLQL